MIAVDRTITPAGLLPAVERLFTASEQKLVRMEKEWDVSKGSPVFTVGGAYTARGWTEWTQGFLFGSYILQFDATGDTKFLESGRNGTTRYMASHVSHIGVHDHGF